jgi:hypothetical protein
MSLADLFTKKPLVAPARGTISASTLALSDQIQKSRNITLDECFRSVFSDLPQGDLFPINWPPMPNIESPAAAVDSCSHNVKEDI